MAMQRKPIREGVARHRVISLFSGVMGLDLGLEATGRFETVAAVESDPACCATIRKNVRAGRTASRDLRLYEGNIQDVAPEQVMYDLGMLPGEFDVLAAGPPCQAFSTTGRRRTVDDPRGTLLWRVIDYVDVFRPKVFVIENVRGLLSAALRHRPLARRPGKGLGKGGPPLAWDEEPGSVMRKWLADLRARLGDGYRMDLFEVNAVNYGAPQLRERAIFVGNRLGAVAELPQPTHGADELPFATLGDAIRGLDDPAPVLLDFSPRKKHYLSMVPPGGNWRCLPLDLQKESMGKAFVAKGGRSGWWRRLSMDLPCPTIVTMPNHASTALTHPDEVRALSVRECAVVQGFPRDWEFTGTAVQQYLQVGNAVPVRLGEVAGDAVADILSGRAQQATAGTADFRLVYLRSHVRTRQWFKAGQTKVWEDGGDNEAARYGDAKTHHRERALLHAAE